MDERTHERIPGDEWTAAALAFRHPNLYAEVLDSLDGLDLIALTKDVLDDPQASPLKVTLALDSWFGQVADPSADEDGE
ncbi:MAG: hypothetical protein ACM3UP_02110 [Methanocella sp.]